MSDQEITDRDETRRLMYIVLAARYPVGDKMAELIGTTAHALTHHATGGNGSEGLVNLAALVELVGSDSSITDGPALWAKRIIDRLSDEVDDLKRPATESPRGVLAKGASPDTPRRAFLRKVYGALDNVAGDPNGRWFEDVASGEVMQSIETSLDAYLGVRDLFAGSRAEVDLAQALDMLDRVLGAFNEKGHPGYEGLRTGWHKATQVQQWRSWVKDARGRMTSEPS